MITTVSQEVVHNQRIGRNVWTVPGHAEAMNLDNETLEGAICREFKTKPEYLRDKIRKSDRIFAKHFYRYFFRTVLKLKDFEVGSNCNCDRCTVIASVKTTKNLIDTDREFREKANRILDKHKLNLIKLTSYENTV